MITAQTAMRLAIGCFAAAALIDAGVFVFAAWPAFKGFWQAERKWRALDREKKREALRMKRRLAKQSR